MAANFRSLWGRWFDPWSLAGAYRDTLGSYIGVERVLPDIAEFCGANNMAPKEASVFERGRIEGRRDVWLHIQEYLHLTEDEIYNLRRGQSIAARKPE